MPSEIADGRLRKGAARRRLLLDATLRLVGRSGVAAVTQRAVAAEADLPPSAVLYYFTSVDDLLVSTLREVNDRYCAELAEIDSAEALAAHLAGLDRARLVAEFELWLLAARREDLRGELERWDAAVADLANRLAPGRPAFPATLDGLYLRAATTGLTKTHATAVLTDTR